MARAKKRSDGGSRDVPGTTWLGAVASWLPGTNALTRLLPTATLTDWLPLATRADLAELSDRLVRLERRLAEHERVHAPSSRAERHSLSA